MNDYTGMFEKIAGKRGLTDSIVHAVGTMTRTAPALPGTRAANTAKFKHFERRVTQLENAMDRKIMANKSLASNRRRYLDPMREQDMLEVVRTNLEKNKHLSPMDKHRFMRMTIQNTRKA